VNPCGCLSHNGFLTVRGYENAQREAGRREVDAMGPCRYLDSRVSVSAMVEVEDDFEYDPNHVELNHARLLQLEIF